MIVRGAFALVAVSLGTLHGACDPGLSGFSGGGGDEGDAQTDAATSADATSSDAREHEDARVEDGSKDGGTTKSCDTDSGLRENGSMCSAGTSCCSDACTENHRCADSCVALDATCSPQASTCCANTYCSVTAGTSCQACISSGDPPEMVGGTPNADSCCSRQNPHVRRRLAQVFERRWRWRRLTSQRARFERRRSAAIPEMSDRNPESNTASKVQCALRDTAASMNG